MGIIRIRKGLDLPIAGAPKQDVGRCNGISQVALLGDDYSGMKPNLQVAAGDDVMLGQTLFTDNKTPSIRYTSPGSGRVIEINRGAKRHFESIVIQLGGNDEVTFEAFSESELKVISREKVIELLIESGLWTALRTRPYSKVPDPETIPRSIFITAMDTNPLAPRVDIVLKGREKDFTNGLTVISRLTEGRIFLCKAPGAEIQTGELKSLSVVEFAGPHPAGNAGTHIHMLDPVSRTRIVWNIGAQDVAAIGRLFTSGSLNVERIVSIAGPSVREPRLIKTRIGASIEDLTSGELEGEKNRVISGSVLSGHMAAGPRRFLGRYHQQISVIPEGGQRKFLGSMNPGLNLYSVKNVVLSRLFHGKRFKFDTSMNGSERAIVPFGSYEKIMPLDILPTFLLKAISVNDIEEAERLGCLELDEEDLALCTFVCPSKIDYGPILRRNLDLIETEL